MEKQFTLEDLRNAFEAGQNQKIAAWENDTTHSIGFYNSDEEMTFDSWFNDNFNNEN